jgi:hypothetical protein
MPRVKKLDASVRVQVNIPESIWTRVHLELYSEIEGKIPFGKQSELVEELLREWLGKRGIAA